MTPENEKKYGFKSCEEDIMHPGHSDSPFLSVNLASVDKIKTEFKVKDFELTYKLFRANLLYRGEAGFEEDNIRDFKIITEDSEV